MAGPCVSIAAHGMRGISTLSSASEPSLHLSQVRLGRGYLDLERKRRQQPISNSDPATITTTTPARRTIRSSLNRSRPPRTPTITTGTLVKTWGAFLESRVGIVCFGQGEADRRGVRSARARPCRHMSQRSRASSLTRTGFPAPLGPLDTNTGRTPGCQPKSTGRRI